MLPERSTVTPLTPEDAVQFEQRLEDMVKEAQEAQPFARSWRHFNVAAVFLARTEQGTEYRTFSGVNMKPISDGPTFCAEQGAFSAALAAGFTHIVGLVVIGKPREEDSAPTLHPCVTCCRSISRIVGYDFPVLTTHNGYRERLRFSELLHTHENPE